MRLQVAEDGCVSHTYAITYGVLGVTPYTWSSCRRKPCVTTRGANASTSSAFGILSTAAVRFANRLSRAGVDHLTSGAAFH